MTTGQKKAVAYWLILGAIMVYIMVLLGGITRLTGSGLSMVDWNLITGAKPPTSSAEWVTVFEKYKEFPQFQKVNFDMTVQEFKSIFWWEYIHRIWGRIIGVVFIIPFVLFAWKKIVKGKLLKQVLVLGLLGAFQGFLGWYMVQSGLIDNPYVSHYRLTAHFITAVLSMGLSLWLAFQLLYPAREDAGNSRARKWTVITLVVLFVQLIYGGFMAGSKAGPYIPTWPDMNGEMIPPLLFSLEPFYRNFTESITGIQFYHRLLAYILVLLTIWLRFGPGRRSTGLPKLGLNIALGLVVVQTTLGILTVISGEGHIPIDLALTHQAVAVLFVASLVLVAQQFSDASSAKESIVVDQ